MFLFTNLFRCFCPAETPEPISIRINTIQFMETEIERIMNLKHVPKGTSKAEMICRATLEFYFSKQFPSVRPNWLLNNKTGYNLELDCFNSELKLALEYNGAQHNDIELFMKKYNKTEEEFKQQQYRDELKAKICKEKQIDLIIIDAVKDYYNIPEIIIDELETLGY